jgi:hypothetical protein
VLLLGTGRAGEAIYKLGPFCKGLLGRKERHSFCLSSTVTIFRSPDLSSKKRQNPDIEYTDSKGHQL